MIKKLIEQKNIKKFIPILVSILFIVIIFVSVPFFSTLWPILIIGLLTILFSILWFMAGFTVFKSFLVASTSLALVLLIGDSYCKIPLEERTVTSADSLKILISFGLIYAIIFFINTLYKELFGNSQAKDYSQNLGIFNKMREVNKGKYPRFIITVYCLLISLFIWQIYVVVVPTIENICVYQ